MTGSLAGCIVGDMTDLDPTPKPAPEPRAAPDRPDPDDVIASQWGDWVHDDRVAASRSASMSTAADIAAPNGAWNQSAALTITAAAPGIYLAAAQAMFAMSTNASGCYGGIKRTSEAAATNGAIVLINMAVGASISVPLLQLFTHTGGDLAVQITFGFGGGGTQCVLKAGSRMVLVRIGPLP